MTSFLKQRESKGSTRRYVQLEPIMLSLCNGKVSGLSPHSNSSLEMLVPMLRIRIVWVTVL